MGSRRVGVHVATQLSGVHHPSSDISSIRCSTCADGGARVSLSSRLFQDSTDVEASLRKSSGVCSPSIANSPGAERSGCRSPPRQKPRRSVGAAQPGRRRTLICRVQDAVVCALRSADLTCIAATPEPLVAARPSLLERGTW